MRIENGEWRIKRPKKLKRMVSFTLLTCFLIVTSTACYDAKEVDDWAYVYSIGIDKGVADKIRMTVQIPSLKGQTSGSGQGSVGTQQKGDYTVISIDCPSIYEGVNLINASTARTLNYMHTKYMAVSEDEAKEGVETFVNGMRRVRQIRRIMYFFVVKGQASDFIKEYNPSIGTSISKTQENMMGQQDITGFFDETTFGEFEDDLKSSAGEPSCALAALNDYSNFLPEGSKPKDHKIPGEYYAGEMPRTGGNKAEFMGTALFDEDKLVGELNGDETRVLLMVKNEFKRASISIKDPLRPEMYVTVDVGVQKSPNIKISFCEGKPVINVELFLEGDLQNLQSTVEYETPKLKKILENSFKEYIKKKLDETIEKCKSLNCEVFNFGDKAVMHFLTIQEWEKYDWLSKFKDAQVTTKVEFTIRRTGAVMKTNPTKGSGGIK